MPAAATQSQLCQHIPRDSEEIASYNLAHEWALLYEGVFVYNNAQMIFRRTDYLRKFLKPLKRQDSHGSMTQAHLPS